jgi:hypothetical protein
VNEGKEAQFAEAKSLIRGIAGFWGNVMLSGGDLVNIADCGEHCRMPAFLAARLKRLFRDNLYFWHFALIPLPDTYSASTI